jgi:catechol 2,3-dioxygenase-like lactoylglutathione lyase family enzyme
MRRPIDRPGAAWHHLGVPIVALDHVQFTMPAGAEERADRFYVDVLGFEAEEKPPVLAARGGRWYRTGTVRFHLGVDTGFRPATRAHPAFAVRDLDALVARLAAERVTAQWDDTIAGTRRCYVDDPFGNRLELVESL